MKKIIKDIEISFDIQWSKWIESQQTVFAVLDRKVIKGVPPISKDYVLRATKNVNWNPFPVLYLKKKNGENYLSDERIKLSLVCASSKAPPIQGSCNCKGTPLISESQPTHFRIKEGEIYCDIKKGELQLSKIRIGCCTGARGHGSPFCFQIEFVTPGSPLFGAIIHSLPIEVWSKGPFTHIKQTPKIETEKTPIAEPTPQEPVKNASSYHGSEQMTMILKNIGLEKYISSFLEQEVDLEAFLQLSSSDLEEMGIKKVGPRIKIMKEISRLKALGVETVLSDLSKSTEESNQWSLTSTFDIPSTMIDDLLDQKTSEANKKRRISEGSSDFIGHEPADDVLSIYVYLSNIVLAKNKNRLKKTLFMIRSKQNRQETENISQQIQQFVIEELQRAGKKLLHVGKAQLILILQPDKNGDWAARSTFTGKDWNFKKGDYIKIDNCHDMDISICIHHYTIPARDERYFGTPLYTEEHNSPKKYPTLFPGGSLQIGVEGNKDGKLALASRGETKNSETFAIFDNGQMVSEYSNCGCIFSFQRDS